MSDDLRSEGLAVLAEQVRALEKENKALTFAVVDLEKRAARGDALSHKFDALLEAVHHLAAVIKNQPRSHRYAREQAREALERAGLVPPGALGKSRTRDKKKVDAATT